MKSFLEIAFLDLLSPYRATPDFAAFADQKITRKKREFFLICRREVH